jgi:sulfur-oxidizing protein SoxY
MRQTTKLIALALAAATAFGPTGALAQAGGGMPAKDMWPDIHRDVFQSRELATDSGGIIMDAPDRAEDAALTPITLTVPAAFADNAKSVTLVIDQNPSPIAFAIEFGPAAGKGDRMISTRVRVDAYTDIHAVMETTDGKLHMVKKFVKAAGGCSAPALKDMDSIMAEIGKMKVTATAGDGTTAGKLPEGQLMIKHPQYSGLQTNQATGYWIPFKYITEMEVKRGSDVIFKLTGGISISEDPNIRFTYQPGNPDDVIEVTATDTDKRTMKGASISKGS